MAPFLLKTISSTLQDWSTQAFLGASKEGVDGLTEFYMGFVLELTGSIRAPATEPTLVGVLVELALMA